METIIKMAGQLVESPQQLPPHVVLLGAGASRAAFPRGDSAGRQVPLMNDLVDIVGLKQEIEVAGESFENDHNFESIYSRLNSGSAEPKTERAKRKIEKRIEEYFSDLHLPDLQAGLRAIRLHDLRHTYASLLIQQGESLAYVQEQLGHSSVQVTVDVYGHLIPGANRAAVDRLDARLDTTQVQPRLTTAPHEPR